MNESLPLKCKSLIKPIKIISGVSVASVLLLAGYLYASSLPLREPVQHSPVGDTAVAVLQETASSSQPAVEAPAATTTGNSSATAKVQNQGLLSKAVSTADAQEESPSSLQALANSVTPDPVTLRIPSIQLVAPIVKTGLEKDGSLHVPSSPDQTGWYSLGTRPGDIGPAVITGHYDSKFGPGILYNLKNIKAGDQIQVVRDDGTVAVFAVDRLALYPQDNFATQEVYGSIESAGLRIITCAGTYSKKTGHYSDDLVVYATLRQVLVPGAYQPL